MNCEHYKSCTLKVGEIIGKAKQRSIGIYGSYDHKAISKSISEPWDYVGIKILD